ncbi:MAG: ComEA family DNA-binding protein [Endozoicomonas sp.]
MFMKKLSAAILLCSAFSVYALDNDRLNINQASAMEIDTKLVFVSEQTANKIVKHREAHGPFKSIDDLAKVDGVSKRLTRFNRSRIRF